MHPLRSHTWLHHPPISYNITFTPSVRTVVDRTVHSLLPAVTLTQLGRRHHAGQLPGNVLPWQGRQETQGEDVGGADKP
jgi:hypothetical protein